jgi:hypothetical protein
MDKPKLLNEISLLAIRGRLLSIAALLLMVCPAARSTVIVVRMTTNEVVIGADSKRTVLREDGSLEARTVCKISQVQDVVFAYGGTSSPSLNVNAFATDAITSSDNLAGAVESFRRRIEEPLVEFLRIVKVADPKGYREIAAPGGTVLQVVFVKFENHLPKAIVVQFQVLENSVGKVKSSEDVFKCPDDCNPGTTFLTGVSQRDRDTQRAEGFWSVGSIRGVRQLIELSIADNERESGPPVDIVRFTNNGLEWMRKPECGGVAVDQAQPEIQVASSTWNK